MMRTETRQKQEFYVCTVSIITGVVVWRADRSMVLRRDFMECWRRTGSLRGPGAGRREPSVDVEKKRRRRCVGDANASLRRLLERAEERISRRWRLPANGASECHRWRAADLLRQLR